MKYILNKNIALRSWWLVPYAYYVRHQQDASGLKKEELEILLKCDGETDIEESEILSKLIEREFCQEARDGDKLTDWQKHKKCDNRYFSSMNWMITDKCNFNCLHCFNATDNCRMHNEYTFEEAIQLLDQAEAAGINGFTITGGEPMLHPRFLDIVREIYKRGMYIFDLNTNGHFLTQEILDEFKKIDCSPLIKISFDGVGHHDWLRNRKGAEKEALAAMKLCVDNGFEVQAQTNIHRKNVDSIYDTAILLDSIGVNVMRVIRTSESPRWAENAGDACLSFEEYLDEALKLVKRYGQTDCKMELCIWQFMSVFPSNKFYDVSVIDCHGEKYRDSLPVCGGNRSMIAVAADGNLFPCHQMSGYYRLHNDFLYNVKEGTLQEALQGGKYLNEVCATLKDLKDNNAECDACKYFKYCLGGCRALGILSSGSKMGINKLMCLFYNNHYFKKIQDALPGLHTYSKLPEELM